LRIFAGERPLVGDLAGSFEFLAGFYLNFLIQSLFKKACTKFIKTSILAN
jgi:hypothetical protein